MCGVRAARPPHNPSEKTNYNNQYVKPSKSYQKMKQSFDEEVANGVATKRKKYVRPEIEVFNLDAQPRLLSASAVNRSFGAGFGDDSEEDW